MDSVKINTSKTLTLTLPSDPASNTVTVSLYHEYGDLVKTGTATRVSTGVYTITFGQEASGIYVLSSAGIHRCVFTYTVSGTAYSQTQYINVYTQYIDSDTFFDSYPELIDSHVDVYDSYEQRARNIINTYCGQSFEFYPNKSFIIDGNNHTNLHLPLPICELKKVTINYGDSDQELLHDSSDSTVDRIERVRQAGNFDSSYYLRFKSNVVSTTSQDLVITKFRSNADYKIEGDFGWRYVPQNVTQAAMLIIADLMNDDSAYRRHGIYEVDMDIVRYKTKDSFYESTGNIEADILLMDYTMFIMDYVV